MATELEKKIAADNQTPPAPWTAPAPVNIATDANVTAWDISKQIFKWDVSKENILKPAKATANNSVVSWNDVTWGATTKPKWVLDGLTLKDIQWLQDWEQKTKIVNEIKYRRDIEGMTWIADPMLTNLWFTTIKDKSQNPSLVSNEASLNVADLLVKGGRFNNAVFDKNMINRPEVISTFLHNQWYSNTC